VSQNRTTRRSTGVLSMLVAAAALQAVAWSAAIAQAPGQDRGSLEAPAASPRPVADSARLSLGALYALLERKNPRIEAARASARAAEARVPSARRPPDPELQLGFMNRELPSLEPMDPLGMTQLQLMQMLPLGGKLGLAGRVAEAQAGAARERAEDIRWDVRARVAMAFYDLYESDRALAIDSLTLGLVQDIVTTTRAMYAVGDGRQADVLRAQVEVARMTEELVRMQAMRVAMSSRLTGLLDTPTDTALPAPALPRLPGALPPLDSLQRLAEQRRPMIRAGMEELRATEAATRLARREIWPDLQVGVQYGQRDSEMGTERMGSLMLGATVPIFARSRQLRMREEAAAMQAMAAADVAAMRADTRARVAELYADIVRARQLGILYRTTILPQAQAAVTSALASYRVSDLPLMQLLDNQMTVNRYQRELVTLDAEQGKALAELEMLVGRELFDVNADGAPPAGSGR
jgi:cobalt-zinc-cadmium efflux system outer membrane protein